MAASLLFVCLSVTLLAASLSVEGQEDLSQLREDMAAYRQQLEDMRHEMDLQRKKTELERHEMQAQLYTLTQREKKLTQQTEGYRQQVEDMRNEIKLQSSEIEIQLKAQRHREEEMMRRLQQQDRQIQVLQETCHLGPASVAESGEVRDAGVNWTSHAGHSKRSDDTGALEPVLSQVTQTLNVVTADVQALKNSNTGSVYVRWGSTRCPSGSETLYSGYMGGSAHNVGTAANYLCLPPVPVFDDHPIPRYPAASLYGTEYETCDEPECDMSAACSVCRTPRQAQVMLPGTNACQDGWHLEYSGYLMTQFDNQKPSEFICVDRSRGYIPGTQGNQDGKLLYYTVVHCTSLSCPPYVDNKIMSCVVCSK